MSAAVAVPLSAINNQLGGVLPPSALVQHSPRHGRNRAMSMKGGKSGQGRRYSVVEERDVSIAKALMFVLKRTITEDEVDEDDEEPADNLVADAEGWVGVEDALKHPKIAALEADLDDIQRVVANASKARFNLRQGKDTKAEEASSWSIRRIPTNRDSAVLSVVPVGDKLTTLTEGLPEFVVYETSYQRYPLLVTAGAIIKAPGGAPFLTFQPVSGGEATEQQTQSSGLEREAAEVSIWINLRQALEAKPDMLWQKTDTGAIVTADEVPKALWAKAVARRPDIGVLFEDGEVRKEVPAGLRGKGSRGKARKGKDASGNKGALKREGSEEESGSASEEQEE